MEHPKRGGRPKGSKNVENRTLEVRKNPVNSMRVRKIHVISSCSDSTDTSDWDENGPKKIDPNRKEINPEASLLDMPIISMSQDQVTQRDIVIPENNTRSSANRHRNFLGSFEEIQNLLKSKIRKATSIISKCCIKGCKRKSKYRSASAIKIKRFCAEHAERKLKEYPDLVDCFGRHIQYKNVNNRLLLFDVESWREIPQFPNSFKELSTNYLPATPVSPTVFFHRNIMKQAFHMSRKGIAAQSVWEIIRQRFDSPPPKNVYKQFMEALQLFCVWSVQEAELKFPELAEIGTKLNWGYFCHCCFGDKMTTKTIVLILDGCFTSKSLKKEGKAGIKSELDDIFYLPTPSSRKNARGIQEQPCCDNFKAGDHRSKAQAGIDVNGVFAAVCVHGFPYKIIDVSKGESLDYGIAIIEEFRRNFPRANLVLAYDIICKLKSRIDAAGINYNSLFLPVLHAYGHDLNCRSKFAPYSKLGFGLEDGENAERFWSQLPYAIHTRFMRPRTRRDYISMHVHYLAEMAYHRLANTIKIKLKRAKTYINSLKNSVGLPTGSYKLFRENLEAIMAAAPTAIQSGNKDLSFKNIESLASSYMKLLEKRKKVRGAKSSAHILRCIQSTKTSLNDEIEKFNLQFPEAKVLFKDVLNITDTKDKTDDQLVFFWKSIEQLIMCYDDSTAAIASLNMTQSSMKLVLKSKLSRDVKQKIRLRLKMNALILKELGKVKVSCKKMLDNYKTYERQVNAYNKAASEMNTNHNLIN